MPTSKETPLKIGNTLDFEDLIVQMSSIPSELAILPVNDAVVFPLMMVPLILRDQNLLRLADEALAEHKIITARCGCSRRGYRASS
jgi:ATP-dependent Lon protease